MVAGDVVNTAARLQTAAPVNGVLVGETTYRATRPRDRLPRGRSRCDAKGKAEPVAGLGGASRPGRGSASTSSRRALRSSGGAASSTLLADALARAPGASARRSS